MVVVCMWVCACVGVAFCGESSTIKKKWAFLRKKTKKLGREERNKKKKKRTPSFKMELEKKINRWELLLLLLLVYFYHLTFFSRHQNEKKKMNHRNWGLTVLLLGVAVSATQTSTSLSDVSSVYGIFFLFFPFSREKIIIIKTQNWKKKSFVSFLCTFLCFFFSYWLVQKTNKKKSKSRYRIAVLFSWTRN